jgi:hypothetical protein
VIRSRKRFNQCSTSIDHMTVLSLRHWCSPRVRAASAPPHGPGVSHALAERRAAQIADVRYALQLDVTRRVIPRWAVRWCGFRRRVPATSSSTPRHQCERHRERAPLRSQAEHGHPCSRPRHKCATARMTSPDFHRPLPGFGASNSPVRRRFGQHGLLQANNRWFRQ